MPLSTRPFFTDNPGDIPYEYVVPATVELRVQSIVARFNGAAASGEFYPCLAIYTQDNHLLARIRTDQKFAIGDTGVVTWGPFLRQQAKTTPTPAGAAVIEWAYYTSTTNWGAGLTDLVFALSGGNYDTVTPTFDVSAGGKPQICRDGHYQLQSVAYNYAAGVVGEVAIRLDVTRISGPAPASWRSFASGVGQVSGGVWSTEQLVAWPWGIDLLSFGVGAFSGTPCTLGVKGQELVDGLLTADVDVIVEIAIQRLGDPFA